jgi:hypothetical protein
MTMTESSRPDAVILPMDLAIDQFFELAARMQSPEYDFDEVLRLCIDNLNHTSYYPSTMDRIILKREHTAMTFTDDDMNIFNQAIMLLYHQLYFALRMAGCYNQDGYLEYTYFKVHDRRTLVVTLQPVY